jgi:hypothetical protein
LVASGGYVKISGMTMSMDKEQMACHHNLGNFRSKPASTFDYLCWWCYGEFHFGFHYLYRDGFAYGDTYIANADEDGSAD